MALRNALTLGLLAALLIGCAETPKAPPPKAAAAPKACAPAPSELVVRDIAPGTGKTLGFRTAANVWYTGWLYDGCKPDFKGKQFDSNVGKVPFPLMVGVGRVIKGWDEGVVGMKEKGKRLLVIPPNKAYGAREFPDGRIPPNSTLVFEVEVANVVHQPAQ